MAEKQRWIPLESNPDVLNKYIAKLGVPPKFQFTDVFGFDSELLAMVPSPVLALMLLYPITEQSEANKLGTESPGTEAYFVKQTIGNACGTVAIVHALANNIDVLDIKDGKPFDSFYKATKAMTPDERASYLEKDTEMGVAHEDVAREGQTEAPSADQKVDAHFVAFVHLNGGLYEFNGRSEAPIHHGPTSAGTLLEDAVAVVKKFMARDPEELNFNLMAFSGGN